MAQIDKVQVQSTTYDVAQSASATFAGTSNDAASPSAWTSVDTLVSGETNGSIFTKISKMFSNIRWLYNQLGTSDYSGTGASTVSGALAALQGGKAAASHSHTTNDLPVSSTQVNSASKIPTSALIYSMNETLTSLNDAFKSTCNMRFEEKYLGSISSTTEANTFFAQYSADNDWKGLSLGNYITINDGTYNKVWMIADFNGNLNKGDSTIGTKSIGLIPRSEGLLTGYMNSTNTTANGFKGSYMWTTTIPTVVTNLQKVLGSHLLKRRILISNAINTNTHASVGGWTGRASGWEWVDCYASIMSEVQVYGSSVFGGGFDVGEANYKLPVFNFINYNQYGRATFWLRAVASGSNFASASYYGDASCRDASYVYWVRPLIYVS